MGFINCNMIYILIIIFVSVKQEMATEQDKKVVGCIFPVDTEKICTHKQEINCNSFKKGARKCARCKLNQRGCAFKDVRTVHASGGTLHAVNFSRYSNRPLNYEFGYHLSDFHTLSCDEARLILSFTFPVMRPLLQTDIDFLKRCAVDRSTSRQVICNWHAGEFLL